jgi:hypothetical protein
MHIKILCNNINNINNKKIELIKLYKDNYILI